MIILPLIERELRTRARGRAMHRTRFAAALVGMLFCLPLLSVPSGLPGNYQAMIGHSIFLGIVAAAFVLCCSAGFLTVDGISRERREGTLGLLCLTRVRPLDILLGSFGAAGITCLCALLAFLPVILLPVLAGGVTGGEAFRTMLLLLDTLLLSLAAGLWASTGARGWLQSAWQTAGVLLLILLVPLFPVPIPYVELLSPLATLQLAEDPVYNASWESYWTSLALVHGLSWLLLLAAGLRLQLAMRDGTGTATTSGHARQQNVAPHKPLADTDDPVRWLVRRQRGIKTLIWTGTLIGLLHRYGFYLFRTWFGTSAFINYYQFSGFAISAMSVAMFAWAASRFLSEGRRTGALELLLTSPVGAKMIVSGQWAELKRLFLLPFVVMVIPDIIYEIGVVAQIYWGHTGSYDSYYLYYELIANPFGSANNIIGILAVVWIALLLGFKSRSQAKAVLWSILLASGAPWAIHLLVLGVARWVSFSYVSSATFGFWLPYLLPQIAFLLYYLCLIRLARRRLAAALTDASPAGFGIAQSFSDFRAGLRSLITKSRQWPPTPQR